MITQDKINEILESKGLPANSVTANELNNSSVATQRLFLRTGVYNPNLETGINLGSLTDGAIINMDCQNGEERKAFLDTSLTASTIVISNFGEVANIVVKKTSGSTAITISGATNYKFIDMDNIAAPAASVSVTCANTYNEISISYSGYKDGDDKILLIIKK